MKIVRRKYVGFISDVMVFFMIAFVIVLLAIPSYFDEMLTIGEKILSCGLPVCMFVLHMLFTRRLEVTTKNNMN